MDRKTPKPTICNNLYIDHLNETIAHKNKTIEMQREINQTLEESMKILTDTRDLIHGQIRRREERLEFLNAINESEFALSVVHFNPAFKSKKLENLVLQKS